MKKYLPISYVFVVALLSSCTYQSTTNKYFQDDLYDEPTIIAKPVPKVVPPAPASVEDKHANPSQDEYYQEIEEYDDGTNVISSYYGDDYNDYTYSSRIRRFHRRDYYDYYSPYYTNVYYYNGVSSCWGTSVYYYSPWSYYDTWGGNSWNIGYYSPYSYYRYS